MKLFSHNLNILRTSWKLTQAEMAQKFGVTTTSFGRWENGTEPEFQTLVEIAKFFKISIDRLLTEELTPQTCPPRWGGREYPQQAEETGKALKEPGDDEMMAKVLEKMEAIEAEQARLRKEWASMKGDT